MPAGGFEEIQFPSCSKVPAYRDPRRPVDSTGAGRACGFLGSSVRSDAHSTPDRGTNGRQDVARSPHPLGRAQERSRRDSSITFGLRKTRRFSSTKDLTFPEFGQPSLRQKMAERGESPPSPCNARAPFFSGRGVHISGKTLEAYYTIWMELFMSKRRILELYLNHIEFGPGIYGIGAAAHRIFRQDSRSTHTRPDDRSGGDPSQSPEMVSRPPESDCSPQDSANRTSLFEGSFSSRGIAGKITASLPAPGGAPTVARRCPAIFE